MEILIVILFLVAVGVLLSDTFVMVPAYHFGVVERFGERLPGIKYEGLRIKLPFIDVVQLISMELSEAGVSVVFTTRDKLQLTCVGSLQYKPDPIIKDRTGRNVFITMSEEIISSGIVDAIKAKLGALGGVKDGEDFIENRHAIGDIINCFFRLEAPPHMEHDPNTCGVPNCKFPLFPPGSVEATDLMEFYKQHRVAVKQNLDTEKGTPTYSAIEERYGIDVVYYALSDIAFSKATQEAFEKERQAKARQEAFKIKLMMAKGAAKDLGAPAQVAFNAADISLDPDIEKKIISVEGEAGILGGLLEAFGGKGGKK